MNPVNPAKSGAFKKGDESWSVFPHTHILRTPLAPHRPQLYIWGGFEELALSGGVGYAGEKFTQQLHMVGSIF